MSTENAVSRRGLFMKLGILFNGLVATALAAPIVGFVLSSITRGRANAYLAWVPLGSVNEFPEGETRLATFRNPNVTPTARLSKRHAGCGASRAITSRYLLSTARTLVARCAGFRSPACLCALATAEPTTVMARVPRVRQNAASSNIRPR